jgi:hypothetical protein
MNLEKRYSMDPIERLRSELTAHVNRNATDREKLEARVGQVWDTKELQEDFSVVGFGAPYVVVRRKHDNVEGTLMFQHNPRFYFSFKEA